MKGRLQAKLSQRIRVPENGSIFSRVLQTIAAVLLYPVGLLFGLLVIVALLPVSIFQKLFSPRDTNKAVDASGQSEWTPFVKIKRLSLDMSFLGEVRFGPAYFKLRSNPEMPGLSDKVFGEWNYQTGDGLLLQQWNSTTRVDTELVQSDPKAMKLQTVLKGLDSVNWTVEALPDGDLLFTCDNGKEKMSYRINPAREDS